MIDEEKEYKKVFASNKKWAKHLTTYSAHRDHSSTQGMIEPAQKTLDFINSIDYGHVTYKEKCEIIRNFIMEMDNKEKNPKDRMGTSFYSNLLSYNEKQIKGIERGDSVEVLKVSRR